MTDAEPAEHDDPRPSPDLTPAPDHESTPAPDDRAISRHDGNATSAPDRQGASTPAREVTSAPDLQDVSPPGTHDVSAPDRRDTHAANGRYILATDGEDVPPEPDRSGVTHRPGWASSAKIGSLQLYSLWLRLLPDSEYGPPQHAYSRYEVLPHEPGHGLDLDRFRPPPGSVPPPSVQAARIIAWAYAALALLLILVTALTSGAESAGAVLAFQLCALILGGLAFGFEQAGIELRNTAAAVATVAVLLGLGNLFRPHPTGLLGLVASIAILVLLFRPTASAWFRRPEVHGDRRRPEWARRQRPEWARKQRPEWSRGRRR
jgi:hypothetical protein